MALTYAQITAITEKYFLKDLADGIYGQLALLARLSTPEKKKLIDGGEKIIAPIISSKPGEGGSFTDLDALGTDRTDNITAAEYSWRQYHEPIRVSRLELLKNSGDAAKLDLVASKVKVAKLQMADNLNSHIFAAQAGTNLDGLQDCLSTSSTYGGIAVADLAEWIAVIVSNSGTARALSLDLMQQVYGSCTKGKYKPTLITGRQNVVDQVWSLFQPYQRLMSKDMADLGFENVLTFNGAPVIPDDSAKAASLQFLNEEFLFLGVHRLEDMRQEVFEKLETSASSLRRIFWAGNLCCNNRRFQGELQDIAVAS